MNTNSALLSLLLGTLLIHPAFAADDANATRWLSQDQEQALSNSVPPPPAPGSLGDKADYVQVLAAQTGRTAAMTAECKRDQHFSYELFEDVYGKELTPQHDPKFHQMMKAVLATTRVVNEAAKNKYQRLRPYLEHPDTIHALFKVEGFSYPSGHAMGSYTLAVVLGAIFPDKKQAFLDRAGEIAQSRVNAGVHNPNDIKEGETLGKATGDAILASPTFQKDLAEVQVELGR